MICPIRNQEDKCLTCLMWDGKECALALKEELKRRRKEKEKEEEEEEVTSGQ
jgi:hypothetical protein